MGAPGIGMLPKQQESRKSPARKWWEIVVWQGGLSAKTIQLQRLVSHDQFDVVRLVSNLATELLLNSSSAGQLRPF